MQLFSDQLELVEDTRSAMRLSKSVLVVSPTGSGKTRIATHMIEAAKNKDRTIIFTVPRKALLEQTSNTFSELGIQHSFIAAGRHHNPFSRVYIGMIDTMARRLDRLPKCDLLIVDECFPEGTMINTPHGEKDIAKMSLGDKVYCATGIGEVLAISVRQSTNLMKVRLSNGKYIETTRNHPFFTKRGWIAAGKLVEGDEFFDLQNMPRLWSAFFPTKEIQKGEEWGNNGVCAINKRIYSEKILLNILLKEDRELYALRGHPRKGKQKIKRNRAQAICAWWQRQGQHNLSEHAFRNDGERLESGVGGKNQNVTMERVSDVLQAGCGKFGKDGRNRGGRFIPQYNKAEAKRCEEGLILSCLRVEGIEAQEHGNQKTVYNLEISGHPSYFANGVLVHNCHFGEGALDSVIKHYKAANSWILGLSATPWKASGKGLGCWFDSMVVGKSIAWLIENKRLSDYRLFYGRTKADFSALKVSKGEFTQSSAAGYMESQGVIIGDCVRDYRERCMGRIHTVRCASIKHSQLVAEQFRNDGIAAVHVDGNTEITELRRVFQAWARRELLVVTFCDLLGFGFDLAQASGVDVCIESGSDLKPSLSLSGQMQYWGRLLRYKDFPAIINDHVNNYMTHGYPDDEREWSLEDREQSKRAASEKTIAVKQCDRCYFAHRPAPVCPSCGNVYPIQSREIDEVEGVLVEATKEERAAKKIEFKKARQSARSYNDLVALGKSRNMSNPHGWAINIMKARGK